MNEAIKVLERRLATSNRCSEDLEQEVSNMLQQIEVLLDEMGKELELQKSLGEAIVELRRGHKSPELQA